MWPVIFICLGGCLLAVGSVWLYDVEHALKDSEEAMGPAPARALPASLVQQRSTDKPATLRPAGGTGPEASATAADLLRKMPDCELAQRAMELEACLRAPQGRCPDDLPFPILADRSQSARETEFHQILLPQAVSLANELLFRLGRVEEPSGVRALPIKLGAAMIASKKPASPRPTAAVARYLAFLAERLSQRDSRAQSG